MAAESVRSAVEKHVRRLAGVRMVVLADTLFHDLSGTESSQGVLTLVEVPVWSLEQLFRGRSLVVVLDGIQDPGNAGAIVRSAEAFGATGVLFLKGTVSPFNPKALRASAGSLFRTPFVHSVDSALSRAVLQQNKLDLYAAVPRDASTGSKSLAGVDLTRKCAIVIGSEGRGVSDALRAGTLDLSIPTLGVESLNAAMAATVILYEARRQRTVAG
jgi:TrmH family RNA methyltransferase